MQIQKVQSSPNFGMAIKVTPAAKKYIEYKSSRTSLEQIKNLIKEQKKNPFDIEVSYVEDLNKNLQSKDCNFCIKVGSTMRKKGYNQTPYNFILSAVEYANKLNAKFAKVEK